MKSDLDVPVQVRVLPHGFDLQDETSGGDNLVA
jgi:hypothetical protein